MMANVEIPAGARVLVLYASANRDEQEWTDPDMFDIRRNATRHLGFGHGTHACAGQGLARLEMQAMLTALMQQVSRIELAGRADMGAQQHHPLLRATAAQADLGLSVVA